MTLPYLNKATHERRTRTPRGIMPPPLHLHRVPGTEKEWCAFGGEVVIYVTASERQEAKQAARRNTPSCYGELNWRRR